MITLSILVVNGSNVKKVEAALANESEFAVRKLASLQQIAPGTISTLDDIKVAIFVTGIVDAIRLRALHADPELPFIFISRKTIEFPPPFAILPPTFTQEELIAAIRRLTGKLH